MGGLRFFLRQYHARSRSGSNLSGAFRVAGKQVKNIENSIKYIGAMLRNLFESTIPWYSYAVLSASANRKIAEPSQILSG